jgi:DNA polymerase-3 subunit delta'
MLAWAYLCETPGEDKKPCCECASCNLFKAGNHPDLHCVRPALLVAGELKPHDGDAVDEAGDAESGSGGEEAANVGSAKRKLSSEISIKQIRDLSQFSSIASTRGGRRIGLIFPAESMAAPAANALLKTLEEPSPGLVLLLASNNASKLLPTIRSRCQTLAFRLPGKITAIDWLCAHVSGNRHQLEEQLEALGGSPAEVLKLAQTPYWETWETMVEGLAQGGSLDALLLAKILESRVKQNEKGRQTGELLFIDLEIIVHWIQRWVYDAIRLRSTGSIRYHRSRAGHLSVLGHVPVDRLHAYACWLNGAGFQALHPVNSLLFLEDCLLRYRALFLTDAKWQQLKPRC